MPLPIRRHRIPGGGGRSRHAKRRGSRSFRGGGGRSRRAVREGEGPHRPRARRRPCLGGENHPLPSPPLSPLVASIHLGDSE